MSELSNPFFTKLPDEDSFDQLNDETFGDEVPWDFEAAAAAELEESEKQTDNGHSDLLGLTGSFFNRGLFKFGVDKGAQRENIDDRCDQEDEAIQIAIGQLDLVREGNKADNGPEKHHELNRVSGTGFEELVKLADLLSIKFREVPKVNSNIHNLHHIVVAHVESLQSAVRRLGVPPEDLNQLNYFKTLKNFLSINTVLANIEARYSNSPAQRHAEISVLFTNFASQPSHVQMELSTTHPFYANLLMLLQQARTPMQPPNNMRRQMQRYEEDRGSLSQSRRLAQQSRYEQVPEWATEEDKRALQSLNMHHRSRGQIFAETEGGWMSMSERDWLARLHTRNLSFDNPYMQDYYYTQQKLKEMTAARDHQIRQQGFSSIPDPITLLPSPVTGDQLGATADLGVHEGHVSTYKPPQFEKALGVLTVSNINTPRQTLQATLSQNFSLSINKSRIQLLSLIEKMYSLILRIDDLDKSLARVVVSNHRGSVLLQTHKNYAIKLLLESINDSEKFASLFTVEKGAKVVLSLYAVIPPAKFVQAIKLFFYNSIPIYHSEHFHTIHDQLRALFLTRIKSLNKEDVSVIGMILFSDMKSSNTVTRPLITFCKTKFGFDVMLGVVELYIQLCPESKNALDRTVCKVIQSMQPDTELVTTCIKQYSNLFSDKIPINDLSH